MSLLLMADGLSSSHMGTAQCAEDCPMKSAQVIRSRLNTTCVIAEEMWKVDPVRKAASDSGVTSITVVVLKGDYLPGGLQLVLSDLDCVTSSLWTWCSVAGRMS